MDPGSGAKLGGQNGGETPDLTGATLGNYRVSGLLGQGGMGAVYRGEHVLIGRKVAIKVLAPHIADDPEAVARFFNEARAVNEIRHPNIVEVTDLGTHGGRPFIVMEYLAGETLERRLAGKLRLSLTETVHVARQMASALGAAHERGLVHRDLKPANVMLLSHPDYPDFVKVLDFGIAKLLSGGPVTSQHQTEVGALLGTPAFMSPEQCLGDLQLDHRSDVYSLGVMMFQMLTGRLPFEGDAVGRLILAHVHQAPPKITLLRPELPDSVAAVVDRALAKKPPDRFASMRELRRELEAACGRPRSLTPVLEVLAAPPPAPGATIVAGNDRSAPARKATPVAPPRPRLRSVTPLENTPAPVLGGPSAAEMLRQGLSEALRIRVDAGTLPYPELPELFVQCLELLRNPSYSFAAVGALIRKDGRLASHLVRRANSDGISGKGTSTSPEQAMSRLGSAWLRVAILELPARKVIDLRDPRFEDIFRKPWQHAMAGAIAGDRLARIVGLEVRAPEAYLAGLLRDAGTAILAQAITDIERELAGRRPPRPIPVETVVELTALYQRPVTAALIRHWQLGEEIAAAIESGDRLDPQGGWSVRNLVKVAGALADRDGFYLRRDVLEDAEATVDAAFRDLGLTDLRAKRVVERLKEAVRLRE